MARIPIQDESTVGSEGLTPPVNTADTSGLLSGFAQAGEAIGRDVSQGISIAGEAYRRAKSKADEAAVLKASNSFEAAGQSLWYDPNAGLMNQRGDAAMQQAAPTYEKLEKQRLAIRGSLANEDQQRLFDKYSQSYSLDLHKVGEVHSAQQNRAAREADFKSGQAMSLGFIAQNYAADDIIENRVSSVDSQIDRIATTPDEAKAMKLEFRGKAYGLAINKRVDAGDVEGADNLLQRPDVQDALGSDGGKDHYARLIQAAKAKTEGTTQANAIISGATSALPDGVPPALAGVDEGKVFEDLAKMKPGPARDVAELEVNRLLTLKKKAQDGAKADLFQQMASAYYQTGDPMAGPASVAKNMQEHDVEGWHKYLGWVREEQRQQREGKGPSQDQTSAYNVLINDMASSPEKYKGMDARVFDRENHADVGDKYFKLLSERLAALKKTPDADIKLTGSKENIISELFQEAFGEKKNDFKSWKPDNQQYWPIVHDFVIRNATQWAKDHHGQEPPEEKVREWAAQQLGKREVDSGHWFIPNKKVPAVKLGQQPAPATEGVHAPAEASTTPAGSSTIRIKNTKTGKVGTIPASSGEWLKTHTDWAVDNG